MTRAAAVQAVIAGLLVVGYAPPFVNAQAAPAALLEDPAGDLDIAFAGQHQAPPASRFISTDLVSLMGEEGRDTITLRLKVAGIDPDTSVSLVEGVRHEIYFTYASTSYRATWRAESGVFFVFGDSVLERYDAGGDYWDHAADIVVTTDVAQATFAVTIERDDIRDENGAPPMPGQRLTAFWVASQSLGFFGDGSTIPDVRVTDRMPDANVGLVALDIVLGIVQTGDARLWSDVPVRSSNGEATTFVYNVEGWNLGEDRSRFRLSAAAVPQGWEVRLPVERIDIDGMARVTFPVLVTTPFAHTHGEFQEMLVEMTGERDAGSVGRIKLGIRYTEIPQPAGHHDTLYLHFQREDFVPELEPVFGVQAEAYMNAAESDAADSKVGSRPTDSAATEAPGEQRYTWAIWLSPGLDMGLDFDLARTGLLRVSFNATLPVLQARMDGYLAYIPGENIEDFGGQGGPVRSRDEPVILATLQAAAQDLPAHSQGTAFEAVVTPLPDADFIAYEAGSALVLVLNLTGVNPEGAMPFFSIDTIEEPLLAGGSMQLPLAEYHDPIADVFASLPTVNFQVVGAQERFVNPGETAVFQAVLENLGSEPRFFTLNLTGYNVEWAELLQDIRLEVPPEGMRNVSIAVRVPVGTLDDDVCDLILIAIDADQPAARALARFVATVDSDVDQPDDAEKAADLKAGNAKGVPAPGVPLLLLALAALVVARRRGR